MVLIAEKKQRQQWKVERTIKWKWNEHTIDNNDEKGTKAHIKNRPLDPNERQTIVVAL